MFLRILKKALAFVAISLLLAGLAGGAYYSYTDYREDLRLETKASRAALEQLNQIFDRQVGSVCRVLPTTEAARCIGSAQVELFAAERQEAAFLVSKSQERWLRFGSLALLGLLPTILGCTLLLLLRQRRGDGKPTVHTVVSPAAATPFATMPGSNPSGELQVRAYLSVIDATVEFVEDWVRCTIRLDNAGQSPALQGLLTARIHVAGAQKIGDDSPLTAVDAASFPFDIASREVRLVMLVWHASQMTEALYRGIRNRTMPIGLSGAITWNDVFGEREPLRVFLRQAQTDDYVAGTVAKDKNKVLLVPSQTE